MGRGALVGIASVKERPFVASTTEDKPSIGERLQKTMSGLPDTVQGSQAWNSIFRPGSIFRKG